MVPLSTLIYSLVYLGNGPSYCLPFFDGPIPNLMTGRGVTGQLEMD